jgi:hypothetical protein
LIVPQGDVIPGGEGGAQKECTGTHTTYTHTYNILRNFRMERVALRRNAQVHIHTYIISRNFWRVGVHQQ